MAAAATRRGAERKLFHERKLFREFRAGRLAATRVARVERQRSDQRVFVGGRRFGADRSFGQSALEIAATKRPVGTQSPGRAFPL